jgi:hypothetical protein
VLLSTKQWHAGLKLNWEDTWPLRTRTTQPAARHLTDTAALMPLAPGAVLITALAQNSLDLRASLDLGMVALGPT